VSDLADEVDVVTLEAESDLLLPVFDICRGGGSHSTARGGDEHERRDVGISGCLADDGAVVATLRSSANTDGDRSRCFRWLTKGLRPHRPSVVVIRRDTM
jgi:hypothetical protein